MNFLFVLGPNEREWSDALKRLIEERGGEVIETQDVDDGLKILRDPETQLDQVIFGSMEGRWNEVNKTAAEKGYGRNFLTGKTWVTQGSERIRVTDLGVAIVDKNGFNMDIFMNRFFPEGGMINKEIL